MTKTPGIIELNGRATRMIALGCYNDAIQSLSDAIEILRGPVSEAVFSCKAVSSDSSQGSSDSLKLQAVPTCLESEEQGALNSSSLDDDEFSAETPIAGGAFVLYNKAFQIVGDVDSAFDSVSKRKLVYATLLYNKGLACQLLAAEVASGDQQSASSKTNLDDALTSYEQAHSVFQEEDLFGADNSVYLASINNLRSVYAQTLHTSETKPCLEGLQRGPSGTNAPKTFKKRDMLHCEMNVSNHGLRPNSGCGENISPSLMHSHQPGMIRRTMEREDDIALESKRSIHLPRKLDSLSASSMHSLKSWCSGVSSLGNSARSLLSERRPPRQFPSMDSVLNEYCSPKKEKEDAAPKRPARRRSVSPCALRS